MTSTHFGVLMIVPSVLSFLGLLAALVITIVQRRRLGRAAAFGITGLSLLLVNLLLNVALPFAWPIFPRRAPGMNDIYMFTLLRSTLTTVIWALGLGLVVAAMFVGRPREQSGPLT